MDIQMPQMDGLEATRLIRLKKGLRPFIISMTANALQEDRDICLRAGMDDYLAKPVKLEDLVAALERAAVQKQEWNKLCLERIRNLKSFLSGKTTSTIRYAESEAPAYNKTAYNFLLILLHYQEFFS